MFDIKEWILLGTLGFSYRWHEEVKHLSFPTDHLMTIILFLLVHKFPFIAVFFTNCSRQLVFLLY